MGRVRIILNPTAGRGYGKKIEPKLCRSLEAEGLDFDLVKTEGPWHAKELAEQALREGIELIVAAGGDGTFHEVVNGLMAASGENEVGTLGVIPIGSGSDFANTVRVPPDLKKACHLLAHGKDWLVDVGRISMPGEPTRYFDNTVNVGFGGVVTIEARKVKRLRGIALYLPVVLKTVFLYFRAPLVDIRYDDTNLTMKALMIVIANGPREGGGFHVAPDAKPDDGFFDLCLVREISRRSMLALIPRFMKGTHVNAEPVSMERARKVIITSEENLVAHADGEILCTEGHRLEFEIIPRCLRVRS